MGKIFISYRREDTRDITGRIYDCLEARFGSSAIFMDVAAIPFGVDFREHIQQAAEQSGVLLAVIGRTWLHAADEGGRRRLNEPDDFVRVEIEMALQRGTTVVPVLVHGAAMPSAADLPTSLQPLAFRNAAEIRSGRAFRGDLDRLIRSLQDIVGVPAPSSGAAAGGVAPEPEAPGQCPECGRTNSRDRVFCGGCGAPLQEPCLACEHVNSAWDRYCGNCGTDLAARRQARIEELEATRQEIGSLRNDCRHAEAINLLEEMAALEHPRLTTLASWAQELLPTVRAELQELKEQRDHLIATAEASLAKHDYDDAVRLLEQVPEPLRTQQIQHLLDDSRLKAREVAACLQARIEELETTRQKTGSLRNDCRHAEAIPLLEDMASLEHPRLNAFASWAQELLPTVRAELARLERQKDDLATAAEASLAKHDYGEAVRLLEQVPEPLRTQQIQHLLADSRPKAQEVATLRAEIHEATRAGEFDELSTRARRYLELKPYPEQVRALAETWLQHISTAADARLREHRYAQAASLLEEVPEALRTPQMQCVLDDSRAKAQEVATLRAGIEEAIRAGEFNELATTVPRYLELKPYPQQVRKLAEEWMRHISNAASAKVREYQYAEAANLLEKVPEALRDEEMDHLLQHAKGVAAELRSLAAAIREAQSAGDVKSVLSSLDRYLELKPNCEKGRDYIDKVRRDRLLAAQASYARHDYEKAANLLEQVPEPLRTQDMRSSLEAAQAKAAELRSLRAEIQEAERSDDLGQLLPKLSRLLSVKPNDDQARRLAADFLGLGPTGCPDDEFREFQSLLSEIDRGSMAEARRMLLAMIRQHGSPGKLLQAKAFVEGSMVGELWRQRLRSAESIAFSPQGRLVAVGGNGRITLLDAATESEAFVSEISDKRYQPVKSVAFSPDGRYVLAGGDDRIVHLLDCETREEFRRFEGHKGAVNTVAFSPDGRFALSGSEDDTIRLWDVNSGKRVVLRSGTRGLFSESTGVVSCVAFSDDGSSIISCGESGIHLWETRTGLRTRTLGDGWVSVSCVALSPDGHLAASTDFRSPEIRFWDVSSGRELFVLEGREQIGSLDFSPDGCRILSGDVHGTVRLWDVEGRSEICALNRSDTFEKKGREQEGLEGRSVPTFRVRWDWDTTSAMVAFSPDGHRAVFANEDMIILWALPK